MKKHLFIIALLLCCIAYAQQADPFKSLHALTGGTWQMKTKKGILGETWKKSNTNELNSEGYKITGKDTTKLEKVQLVKKDDGIYYISTIKDQNDAKPIPFKLISSTNNQFVFSNPEHDFPQRIVYHMVTPDSLHAWIDGNYNGKFIKQDFYYKRVK